MISSSWLLDSNFPSNVCKKCLALIAPNPHINCKGADKWGCSNARFRFMPSSATVSIAPC